ncbi:Vancomycin B-type resistance protein VanW [Sporotomaculum syntrophicum]|uniref:Vancomycin B-type resistance protein VanW n=1 Tax=Sporotomaculum syntrophicum TaxID=182264 RepID=A0A9D2WS65_9FIRM|nr:VanW family protein [Sporotomaculum syntrophicum]KAF1086595.1 Vancomycin B-type resistance protein VanW [Sporotomaculum syntrophicum]
MRRVGWLFGFLALLVVGVLFGCSGASFANSKITPGVYVGNLNLGGLTKEQARELLTMLEDEVTHYPVVIKHGDNTWTIKAGELGVTLDKEKTLQKAVAIGHAGSIINQWRERRRVEKEGEHIQSELSTSWDVLKKKIIAEMGQIIVEPVNAGFQITPGDQVIIVPAQTGTDIDFNSLASEISRLVSDGAINGAEVGEVELPLLSVQPQRTTEDVEAMQINGRIAQYTTRFDAGQEGRTYNIKVAAAALDGLLLAPGDDFSFNQVVGPRSSEAGYKSANVIVNNEFVQGLGGGVCQVSSTLYNAVLLANLQILERSNHTLPVSYVPIGQDATVSYGAIDFRFANNQENYIYITSLVEGNTITFKIYGNQANSPRVEVTSWITETIPQKVIYEDDPNLAAGEQVIKQKGNNGFKVASARHVWENGEKRTEQLPASYYHAVNRIVAVGTGKAKPTVVVPPESAVLPVSPGVINQPVPQEPAGSNSDETTEPVPPAPEHTNPVEPGVPSTAGDSRSTESDGQVPENGDVPPATGDSRAIEDAEQVPETGNISPD